MRKPCPSENEACKYYASEGGCYVDTHHTYWPRRSYTTQIEKEFRRLPENQELLCRVEHEEAHTERPPEKPTRDEMIQAIASHMVQEVA